MCICPEEAPISYAIFCFADYYGFFLYWRILWCAAVCNFLQIVISISDFASYHTLIVAKINLMDNGRGVVVYCRVLHCDAVCCNVLQRAAVYCIVLQCAAVYCSVWQFVAVCYSSLQKNKSTVNFK